MPKWQKLAILVGVVWFAAAAPHDFTSLIHSLETALQSLLHGLNLH